MQLQQQGLVHRRLTGSYFQPPDDFRFSLLLHCLRPLNTHCHFSHVPCAW
jgi:hypothetical protein